MVSDVIQRMHSFVRDPDGRVTDFEAPRAGTGTFQGTLANTINSEGMITGYYIVDAA